MKVCIKETLEKVIDVDSKEEAEKMWRNEEIILSDEDFKGVEFIEYKS